MKRTRKWHKKLTMKEIRHVNEFCGGTIRGLMENRERQKAHLIESPDAPEPCWDCRIIAKKLGVET